MISRHYQAAPFVTSGDQLKQNRAFSLILVHITKVLEDDEVVFVELLDRARSHRIGLADGISRKSLL